MKNKKLFAILTLVCFMFTLMPVAAFAFDEQASYISVEDATVEKGEELVVVLDMDGSTGSLYLWVEEDGYADVAVKAVEFVEAAVATEVATVNGVIELKDVDKNDEITIKINRASDFTVHAATENPAKVDIADITTELRADGNAVSVVAEVDSNDYVMVIDGKVVKDGKSVTLTGFDSTGIDPKTVTFVIYEEPVDADKDGKISVAEAEAADAVYAKGIEIEGSNSVDITELDVKRAGTVKFDVTVDKAGTHRIYVSLDSFNATIKVDATAGVAEDVEAFYVAKTPVNIKTANSGLENSLVFKIYDENGNELLSDAVNTESGYHKTLNNANHVAIVEQPEDSKIKNSELSLVRVTTNVAESNLPMIGGGTYAFSTVADGWTIKGAKFVEEGTYTFKVALDDGTSAKATIKVMEADDPVALNVTFDANSVQLGDSIKHFAVVHLDKNYVATSLTVGTDVKIAVNGAAVEWVATENKDMDGDGKPEAAGTIKIKDNEKYVGTEIKVSYIDEENNLVATKVLTVAAEAKELVADVTAVPVDQTRTVTMQLVDEDGNNVALTGVTTASAAIIVLDKPVNADVTADVKSVNAGKGQVAFTFSSDAVGVVEVQVVLQADVNGVVRYYTGVAEIKVGATGNDNVVVMSIGSDQIVINNKVEKMLCAAVIKDGRTMVPFRAGLEALGAKVDYDQATQSVIAELDGVKVVMTIGEKVYTVNGVAKTADVAPYLNVEASTTMVPASFVANEFGINVDYTTNPDGTVADVLFAN